jgi:hypothetical protein
MGLDGVAWHRAWSSARFADGDEAADLAGPSSARSRSCAATAAARADTAAA